MQLKLLLVFLLFFALHANAFTTKQKAVEPITNSTAINASNSLPVNITLSSSNVKKPSSIKPTIPKLKLNYKQKVVLFLLKHKLLKYNEKNKNEDEGAALGKASLKFALLGYGSIIVAALVLLAATTSAVIGISILSLLLSLAGFVFLLLSLIKGIKALKRKKGDSNAIIGVVLSGLYFLIVFLYILAIIATIAML